MSARPEERVLTVAVTIIVLALVIAFILSQFFYLNGTLDETREIVIGGSLAFILMLTIIIYVTMLTRWDNSATSEYERLQKEKGEEGDRD